MRSKFIEQVKYIDDIKTAGVSHIGYDSAMFIVIGGTDDTAIKVQHCDTLSGVYSDFATIVASADADSSTNEGVTLDISGAKAYLKVTGATTAVAVFGDAKKDPA